MSNLNHPTGVSKRLALLAGVVFGMAWYLGAQSILGPTGMVASALPLLGAVGFAAGLPILLLGSRQSMPERHFAGLDALSDEIWIIHRKSGNLKFINKAACARSGLITGAPVWNGFPKNQHQFLHDALVQTDTQSSEIMRFDEKCFLPLITPFGDGAYVILLLRDVTAELAQQKAKEDFISTVSHELRSPLTAIKGSMGLLLSNRSGDLPSPARRLLEIAHRNADRLTLLINDILDLQKVAEGGMNVDLQELDAIALVQEAVLASSLSFQRFDLHVEIKETEKPVLLFSDPNRIIQVLGNLLTNAAKFSKPGGKITIAITKTENGARISVRDYGIGIPSSEQVKIFERFANLSNSDRQNNGGSGLGLSICKAIIETLGGKIGFDSAEGVGTTFYIDLPRGDGMARVSPVFERIDCAG